MPKKRALYTINSMIVQTFFQLPSAVPAWEAIDARACCSPCTAGQPSDESAAASAALTPLRAMQVTIKTPAEQEQMRVAGRLAAEVLDMIGAARRARA